MDSDPLPTATLASQPEHHSLASGQHPAARPTSHGGLLTALVVVEGVLLFLSTGSLFLASGAVTYGGSGAGLRIIQSVLALTAIASFTLPLVIGMLARSWRAAAALPMLGAWLGLALTFVAAVLHATGVAAAAPPGFAFVRGVSLGGYWLNLTFMLVALVALLLFGALGWIGWAAWGPTAGRE